MLQAAEALFRDSKEQLAIAHDACGGIVHLRIIDSQSQQIPILRGAALALLHIMSETVALNFDVAHATENRSMTNSTRKPVWYGVWEIRRDEPSSHFS